MEENFGGFIGVHVGAGNHSKAKKPEYERVCKKACRKAIEALQHGKNAREALVIAIRILEDNPMTNAGIGSNLNLAGDVECDASMMDGQLSSFGAVGALPGVRNPIVVAQKLVEEQNISYPSGRVPPMYMCGEGALDWAVEHGIVGVSRKSLITDNALKSFKKFVKIAKKDDKIVDGRLRKKSKFDFEDSLLDTVGGVCVDRDGNISSGVSSGGLLLKYPGRVGQAAVYGAGCWAQNMTKDCPVSIACSSSGCGEQIIKTMLCKECADLCTTGGKVGKTILQKLLQDKFLDSRGLSQCGSEKLAGLVLLQCELGSSRNSIKVDFSWAHTTQTMAVGYMAANDQTAKFELTNLEAAVESKIFSQGVVKEICLSNEMKT